MNLVPLSEDLDILLIIQVLTLILLLTVTRKLRYFRLFPRKGALPPTGKVKKTADKKKTMCFFNPFCVIFQRILQQMLEIIYERNRNK